MKRMVFLIAVLGPLAVFTADAAPIAKPNVVIIFIGDIGPFGATQQKTPHLDRMAREGMKFTSFYAAPVSARAVRLEIDAPVKQLDVFPVGK